MAVEIKDKVVIVTGASAGISEAAARLLVREAARCARGPRDRRGIRSK
jgi:NADP-dependent 3-hydroxy acid dehydrogenase YdfG